MKQEDVELLLNANRILASTLEIDKLLKVVLKLAAQVVHAETGSLLLLDEKTNELVFDIALGEAGKDLKEIRLQMGEGIAGWVAREQKSLVVNDPANDSRWTRRADQKTKFVTRSILCVPMTYQGRLLGVVQAINRGDPSGFSEDDCAVLEAFAAQVAVALENARLFSSLRQEKEKVETIFSQMADGAVFSDAEGALLLANPSARLLLGLSAESLDGQNFWTALGSFAVVPALAELRQNPDPVASFEASRQEGKTLILTGLLKKILSDRGELIGHLAVFRDATAEKKEEKLKRDFLSLMSHKLKTPLVAITGYTPMLLEDEEIDKFNPFFKKAISSIHSQGLLLKQLVEKLITFSLIEAQEMTLVKKPHAARELFDDVLKGMRTYLEEKKATVDLDASLDGLPPLPVDYDKFREVIKSLLENAVKFNSNEARSVRVFGRSENKKIFLSIQDNGRGIPSEECEKIFDKFYQIEESFTGQVEGAGLGLALVKRLVESHGGRVKVESKLGHGSTFTIDFPSEEAVQ